MKVLYLVVQQKRQGRRQYHRPGLRLGQGPQRPDPRLRRPDHHLTTSITPQAQTRKSPHSRRQRSARARRAAGTEEAAPQLQGAQQPVTAGATESKIAHLIKYGPAEAGPRARAQGLRPSAHAHHHRANTHEAERSIDWRRDDPPRLPSSAVLPGWSGPPTTTRTTTPRRRGGHNLDATRQSSTYPYVDDQVTSAVTATETHSGARKHTVTTQQPLPRRHITQEIVYKWVHQ